MRNSIFVFLSLLICFESNAQEDQRSSLNPFYGLKGPFTLEGSSFSFIPNKSFSFFTPYRIHFSRHYQSLPIREATEICKKLNGVLPDLKTMKMLRASNSRYAMYWEEKGTGLYQHGESFFLTTDKNAQGKYIIFSMSTGAIFDKQYGGALMVNLDAFYPDLQRDQKISITEIIYFQLIKIYPLSWKPFS